MAASPVSPQAAAFPRFPALSPPAFTGPRTALPSQKAGILTRNALRLQPYIQAARECGKPSGQDPALLKARGPACRKRFFDRPIWFSKPSGRRSEREAAVSFLRSFLPRQAVKRPCGRLHRPHRNLTRQRHRRCLKTGMYRFSSVPAMTIASEGNESSSCHVSRLPP